jgi:uncharacterized protein (DUF1778 family)
VVKTRDTEEQAKARIEVRLDPDVKDLIQHAANLSGGTLTDFVVTSARAAAEEIVQNHQIIELSRRDAEILFEALMNPPEPNAALREASKRYEALVKAE